ncbi:hypothetical protein J6590_067410 [Homalodisca vitripennis]|nr:hypothetical protein J6590_067410 [Homalodisca vitripennis]
MHTLSQSPATPRPASSCSSMTPTLSPLISEQINKKKCYTVETQTDDECLKSKDQLLARISELTNKQSSLISYIQELKRLLEIAEDTPNKSTAKSVTVGEGNDISTCCDNSTQTEPLAESSKMCRDCNVTQTKMTEFEEINLRFQTELVIVNEKYNDLLKLHEELLLTVGKWERNEGSLVSKPLEIHSANNVSPLNDLPVLKSQFDESFTVSQSKRKRNKTKKKKKLNMPQKQVIAPGLTRKPYVFSDSHGKDLCQHLEGSSEARDVATSQPINESLLVLREIPKLVNPVNNSMISSTPASTPLRMDNGTAHPSPPVSMQHYDTYSDALKTTCNSPPENQCTSHLQSLSTQCVGLPDPDGVCNTSSRKNFLGNVKTPLTKDCHRPCKVPQAREF